MIKKSLLFLLLLISSSTVYALGLGGISVNSALNQPLDAKIRLISVEQMAIDDIRVSLASPDEFRRAGIERPFQLAKLRFKVFFPEKREPYIQVSTRETVREPYLNFLLKVNWPKGSLIREFTVLLDPPTYHPPRAAASARKTAPKPTLSEATQAVATPASYGPIQRTETLWVIAGKVQSDPAISRNRTMVALLNKNPDAFHKGNINLLKKGALLAIPTPQEFAAVSERQARATVKQQMDEWRKGRQHAASSSLPTPAEVVAETTTTEEPQAVEPVDTAPVTQEAEQADTQAPVKPQPPNETNLTPEERQRLRVVETDRSWQIAEKSGTDYPVQESDKLREAIKDSEQELVAVQEINKDIVELRAALESKVEALKKALDEKDAQLENLRKQIAQVGAAEGGPSKPLPGAETGAAATVPAVVAPQGNVPVTTPVTKINSIDAGWKDEYWMILMGAIIVVLSTLLLLNLRGRQRQTAFETPELFEMSGEEAHPEPVTTPQPVASHSIEASQDTPVESMTPEEATPDADLLPEKRTDIASVLMEADIYLAYRRYSQAETLVEEAMEQNPESPELKAKLLEIYAFRRDKKSFTHYLDQVYQSLMTQSPELWDKVVEMGQHLVPEHPAWLSDESAGVVLPVPPEVDPEVLPEPDPQEDILPNEPFELGVDLDDLEIMGGDSEPTTFGELIQNGDKSEDEDVPSLDIDFDFDFEEPEDPQKDK
ncbi:type IV pilus assembly protein FimV [Sedimenticola sp.]|uniref:type IV pilus assembly protein FimV n=1 Tax=Sedimenticola sp. TaxID=1940285 RepID=UPI003D150245